MYLVPGGWGHQKQHSIVAMMPVHARFWTGTIPGSGGVHDVLSVGMYLAQSCHLTLSVGIGHTRTYRTQHHDCLYDVKSRIINLLVNRIIPF